MEAQEAVVLLFRGETPQAMAGRFGVTAQTVRNRLKDFVGRAEEVGLEEASREYGVEVEVKSLVGLARKINKIFSLEDCVRGSEIATILTDINLETKHCKQFLEKFYGYSVSNDVKPTEMGALLVRFMTLSQETDKDYRGLVSDWEKKRKELSQLEGSVKEHSKELVNLETELKKLYDEADTTGQEVDSFDETRKSLRSYNLDISDTDNSHKVLKELARLGHDPGAVVDLILEHGSLQRSVEGLKEEVKEQETVKMGLDQEKESLNIEKMRLEKGNTALRKMSERLKAPLDALGELNSLGLLDEGVISLRDLVHEAGSTIPALMHGLKEMGGVEQMLKERLEEKARLELQVTNLDENRKRLKEDIRLQEETKNRLVTDCTQTLKKFTEDLASIRGDFKGEITDPETGLKTVMANLVTESLQDTKRTLEEYNTTYLGQIARLKVEMGKISEEIEDSKNKIFQLGVTMGQYRSLQIVANLIQGTEMPQSEHRLALAAILDLASHGLYRLNLGSERKEVEKIRDNLLYK